MLDVVTRHGAARVHLHAVTTPRAALVLGHGAGGGVDAPDLLAARDAAVAEQIGVALVEQPYRVAGRRSPAPASQLDAAWADVLKRLRAEEVAGLRLIVGGRSLGARVACRTAEAVGAVAVLCLAFPLEPPQRRGKPPRSRLAELEAVTLPTLVVQGEHDRFGVPPPGPGRRVVRVPGEHGLRKDVAAVGAAVQEWLHELVACA